MKIEHKRLKRYMGLNKSTKVTLGHFVNINVCVYFVCALFVCVWYYIIHECVCCEKLSI